MTEEEQIYTPYGKLTYDAESLKEIKFDKCTFEGVVTVRRHPLLVALDRILRREKRGKK